jgi:hypothetical protein
VPTQSGFCYWVTFIDDYSCWCTIVLLRKKSDMLTEDSSQRSEQRQVRGKAFYS